MGAETWVNFCHQGKKASRDVVAVSRYAMVSGWWWRDKMTYEPNRNVCRRKRGGAAIRRCCIAVANRHHYRHHHQYGIRTLCMGIMLLLTAGLRVTTATTTMMMLKGSTTAKQS